MEKWGISSYNIDFNNILKTDYFDFFTKFIKSSITSSADVGLIIFGLIACVSIIITIINHFSKHSFLKSDNDSAGLFKTDNRVKADNRETELFKK